MFGRWSISIRSNRALREQAPIEPVVIDWTFSRPAQWANFLAYVAAEMEGRPPSPRHLFIGLFAADAENLSRYWPDGRGMSCAASEGLDWRHPRHKIWTAALGSVGRKANRPKRGKGRHEVAEVVERSAALALSVRPRAVLLCEHILAILCREPSETGSALRDSGVDLERLERAIGIAR
ncbi:MAG: hypothetical protein ACRD2H_11255 [Terriglobales bacterium]